MGVLGDTPVREHLNEVARYATIEGCPPEVRTVVEPEEALQCQLLFIGQGGETVLDDVLVLLRDKPVLTVADTEGFAQRGIHINFYARGIREVVRSLFL